MDHPLIMGVINCTPDSFYDGGQHLLPGNAVRHGRMLASQGAKILDVGGESTRPGSLPVAREEERERVLPVIEGLSTALELSHPEVVLSVDTTKAEVAAAALAAGAAVVNDISACRFDPELLDVLCQYQPGYVLMHALGTPATMQSNPSYENVLEEVRRFFEQRMNVLVQAGLPEDSIILDPGIGFGKLLEHNLRLLRDIGDLLQLGRPLLVGISNKSFWKSLLGLELEERETVNQVATALLTAKGVRVHRVHDVEATRRTLRVCEALSGGGSC
ncbi:dihydropteroate synthase [Desulfonatronum parangueonense]